MSLSSVSSVTGGGHVSLAVKAGLPLAVPAATLARRLLLVHARGGVRTWRPGRCPVCWGDAEEHPSSKQPQRFLLSPSAAGLDPTTTGQAAGARTRDTQGVPRPREPLRLGPPAAAACRRSWRRPAGRAVATPPDPPGSSGKLNVETRSAPRRVVSGSDPGGTAGASLAVGEPPPRLSRSVGVLTRLGGGPSPAIRAPRPASGPEADDRDACRRARPDRRVKSLCRLFPRARRPGRRRSPRARDQKGLPWVETTFTRALARAIGRVARRMLTFTS